MYVKVKETGDSALTITVEKGPMYVRVKETDDSVFSITSAKEKAPNICQGKGDRWLSINNNFVAKEKGPNVCQGKWV